MSYHTNQHCQLTMAQFQKLKVTTNLGFIVFNNESKIQISIKKNY